MAGVLQIIAIQLCAVFLYGKPMYSPGRFLYSRCNPFNMNSICEPIYPTSLKGRREKSSIWPPGRYAILMPSGVCPESESRGWRKSIFQIKQAPEGYDLKLNFCIKIDRSPKYVDLGKWMSGTYTIHMSGVICPEGFVEFNRIMVYETFSHFGPVPNFSIVEDSGNKTISFHMCGRNATTFSRDESEFDTTDTQFLCQQFMGNEDCAGLAGTVSSGYLMLSSGFHMSSGTLSARNPGDSGLVWYQFDLGRTLPVSYINIFGPIRNVYIGCYYNNVKWIPPYLDEAVCRADIDVKSSYISLKMRFVVQARFVTLLFNETNGLQTSQNFQIFLSDLPEYDICNEDLGMKDGSIQGFQITASSWLPRNMPSTARPLSVGWCALATDSKPWILVDLIGVTRVEGFSVWTRARGQNATLHNTTGCSSFVLFYGLDIETLVMYNDTDFNLHAELMADVQIFVLLNSIDTRYVKFEIRNCVDDNKRCLSFELHGCKLAGIPALDCHTDHSMFELDREIRTEGNPVIYKNTDQSENCPSLCFQKESCSIVSSSKDGYCIEYPPSKLGVWEIADTVTGKWFAKLCDKDYVELSPKLYFPDMYETITNVEYIKKDSIIKSIGYPFSYGKRQDYTWQIQYLSTRYVKLVFTNLSLSYEDEGCYDKLGITSTIDSDDQEITHTYNGRMFVFETEESLVFLIFSSCFVHRHDTARGGLRAIVTGENIPACLSFGVSFIDWNDGRRREICLKPTMMITSMSILNFPFEDIEEAWEISVNSDEHYTVQLDFLDFYVMCPQVTGDIRSTFAIVEMAEDRTFCNTDKPLPVIYSKAASISLKFLRRIDLETVYLRKEGFRLRYSVIDHSLAKLKDHNYLESKVCSKTFRKCYHVKMSLKTWNQASETCRNCDQTLVSVRSEYELQFVNYILRDHRYVNKINVEDAGSFSSHIGLRHVNLWHGEKTYIWENASPATYFPWNVGFPAVGKDCTRTNFQFISNRTFESEDCTTDPSLYFVCQSPMTENKYGGEGKEACMERENTASDIVFIIYRGIWTDFNAIIEFIQELVNMFNVGQHATQIAVVTFSDNTEIEFHFNDIKANEDAQKQIGEIEQHYGNGVYTHLALEAIRLDIFSPSNGARENVPQIGILLTDESSADLSETLQQAQLAKAAGIKLLAIGIRSINGEELKEIVSKPSWDNYIFRKDSFGFDFDLRFEILRKISNIVTSVNSCRDVIWKNWKLTENVNLTLFGTTCQSWTALSTRAENDFTVRFPDFVIPSETHNFCQDPDSSGILWCYTAGNRQHLWEPCFMQLHNMESNYVIAEDTDENGNCKGECKDGRSTHCDNLCNLCDGVFNHNDFSDETLCREKGHYLIKSEAESLAQKRSDKIERGPYFLCGSKEWISILSQCDDVIDCVDASDELNCSSLDNGFSKNVFSCADGDCDVCDFIFDYISADEEVPEFRTCESGEYECDSKQCISMDKRCNAVLDCIDDSDEKQCDSCKDSFHCDNVKCIPLRLKCDTVQDCEDGTDENSCVLESLPSCDQWWEHGYHTSGYYVIDDISVYCEFTSIKKFSKITMSLRNIDVAIDGDKGQMYTRSLSEDMVLFTTPMFRDLIYRDGYSCFLEVKRTCQFPTMMSFLDGFTDNNMYQDCQCKVDTFKAEKPDQVPIRNSSYLDSIKGYRFVKHESLNCNGTEYSEAPIYGGYYNVTGDGNLYIDGRILKKEIPLQIVPEQIVCTYEYRKDTIACAGENQTIPPSMMCVYDVDNTGVMTGCRSGSHLQNCGKFKCPPNTIKCPGSYCIPLGFICDGSVHCPGGEDEYECACTHTTREVLIFAEDVPGSAESTTAASKLAHQFYATGSVIRLLYFKPQVPLKVYNIDHRLLEIREEKYNDYSFQSLNPTTECRFKSMARNLLGQIQFATNNAKGIVFIEDSLESSKVAELMFSNLSKPGFMIYRVLKESSFTVRHGRPGTYKFVKDIPIHRWSALYFLGYKRFPEICKAATEVPCSGGYRCAASKQCIPLDQICDGISQCHGKDDERLCDLFCPHNCTCIGYTVSCRAANLIYNDIKTLSLNTRIADMSNNQALKDVLMNNSFRFTSMTKLNMSSCEISNVNKNGFSFLHSLKCLDMGYNRIQILPDRIFSHLKHLVYLNLDGNFELREISSTAFHGLKSIRRLRITGTKLKRVSSFTFSHLTLQSLSISYNEITEIESYAFNGSSVQKIDFRGNKILTVNRMMFDGVSLLEQLQTPAFKFCCIRPCSVDESNCFPPKNEFSSCEDLMRHPVLQAVLWIVGTTALLGNLGSLFYRTVYDAERLKIGYGIFVTNLAGADFLMGVYLIMIAIADSFYRNRYIYFDEKWRNSGWCMTAGIISTVSSEASVLFVCLITLDRLLVIKYPFGTKRFEPKKAHICCILSWAIALLLALIPVVYTGYFENRFYSRSAVCVAIPLTRDKPPGWMYSVSIFVGLNFCTFMLVAFGQLSIFLELRKATAGIKKTPISRKRDLQVARNLIFVATTDFLCWFPIGLMGVMALNGYPVPGDVYAWTVVFILPLNSALNPVLYTLTAIIGKRSFNPDIEEQNRTEIQKEIASGILKYQELIRSIRLKSEIARVGQSAKVLLEKSGSIPTVTVLAIGIQVSKYLALLHESSIGIDQLSTDTTYVKVSKKKRYRVNIVLDCKIAISNDEKVLQDNIYQLGKLLRRLIANRR